MGMGILSFVEVWDSPARRFVQSMDRRGTSKDRVGPSLGWSQGKGKCSANRHDAVSALTMAVHDDTCLAGWGSDMCELG